MELQRKVEFHGIQFKITSQAKITYKTQDITKILQNPQVLLAKFVSYSIHKVTGALELVFSLW